MYRIVERVSLIDFRRWSIQLKFLLLNSIPKIFKSTYSLIESSIINRRKIFGYYKRSHRTVSRKRLMKKHKLQGLYIKSIEHLNITDFPIFQYSRFHTSDVD